MQTRFSSDNLLHPWINLNFMNSTVGNMPFCSINTVKPAVSGKSKRTPKLVFNTDYCLMQWLHKAGFTVAKIVHMRAHKDNLLLHLICSKSELCMQ